MRQRRGRGAAEVRCGKKRHSQPNNQPTSQSVNQSIKRITQSYHQGTNRSVGQNVYSVDLSLHGDSIDNDDDNAGDGGDHAALTC